MTVTVEVELPLATTGPLPVMVDVEEATLPAMKVTLPSALMIGVAIESVLISARVELRVHVASPLTFVAEHDP